MNLKSIPSFGGELETTPSNRTPVYESANTGAHVREYDIFGGGEGYLGYVDQTLPQGKQLEHFANIFKVLWERIAETLPIPQFQVVVGELSTGRQGVYVIVESVFGPEEDDLLLDQECKDSLRTFFHTYGDYLRKETQIGGVVWTDLRPSNIKYGHTKNNPHNKWYIVDLDPIVQFKLSEVGKNSIVDSFADHPLLDLTKEEIEQILVG